MSKKEHVENFLRINEISFSAPDDEIRAALISAHWQDADINSALRVLRGEEEDVEAHLRAGHQLLYSDSRIAPAELSTLLGIGIKVQNLEHKETDRDRAARPSWRMIFMILLLTCVIVGVGIGGGMYLFNSGSFWG